MEHKVMPLYGVQDQEFLTALGLTAEDAYRSENDTHYFQSDTLIGALNDSLTANETTTKAALESYMAANGGTAMPETDESGRSSVDGLAQGLYLVVETRVPEDVVDTTAPFLVSLPMTTIDGDQWNYEDVYKRQG